MYPFFLYRIEGFGQKRGSATMCNGTIEWVWFKELDFMLEGKPNRLVLQYISLAPIHDADETKF